MDSTSARHGGFEDPNIASDWRSRKATAATQDDPGRNQQDQGDNKHN